MKEATGELSTTVIAIVAIAAILAIFTAFLLPMLRGQIALTQACNNGPNYTTKHENSDNKAIECTGKAGDKTWTCKYFDENGSEKGSKECSK